MGLDEFRPRFADAVRLDGVDILEELGRCEPDVVVGAYEHEMDNFSVIGCGQTDRDHGLNRLIVDLGLRWSEVPDCQFIVDSSSSKSQPRLVIRSSNSSSSAAISA